MKKKKYVVRLFAPVSVRVLAGSRKAAISKALKHVNSLEEIKAGREADENPIWLEATAWKHDKEDFEGGVYLAQGEEVINPEEI